RFAGDDGPHRLRARLDLKREVMTPAAHAKANHEPTRDFLAPVFSQYPFEVASARGVWLFNSRGERVLDLYGGHAVAALATPIPAGRKRSPPRQARATSRRTPFPCASANARRSAWCA